MSDEPKLESCLFCGSKQFHGCYQNIVTGKDGWTDHPEPYVHCKKCGASLKVDIDHNKTPEQLWNEAALRAQLAQAEQERDALQQQVQAMRNVLKRLEWWRNLDYIREASCPICHKIKGYGHTEDCELAAALAARTPAPEKGA